MNSHIHKKDRNIPFLLLGLVLMAVFTVSILIVNRNQRQKKETEIVYKETKKALELLSTHLNRGMGKMAPLTQFETTLQKIYNH